MQDTIYEPTILDQALFLVIGTPVMGACLYWLLFYSEAGIQP